MNDPDVDIGTAIFTASQDGACGDGELLRRISQGDEDAMAAFYRARGRVVLAQVLLVTGERVLAEEIVQDTMLAVWRSAGSFRGESSVRSWVVAISRRKTGDRLRGRRLVIKTASGQPVTVTTTASTFMTMSGPVLGDITDGASVMVHGDQSGGTFQAAVVTLGQRFSAVNPAGFAVVQG
jgi:hypothetical protein